MLDGAGQRRIASAASDASGKFTFANVSRGSYVVEVEAREGWTFDASVLKAKVVDKNVVLKPFRLMEFQAKVEKS